MGYITCLLHGLLYFGGCTKSSTFADADVAFSQHHWCRPIVLVLGIIVVVPMFSSWDRWCWTRVFRILRVVGMWTNVVLHLLQGVVVLSQFLPR